MRPRAAQRSELDSRYATSDHEAGKAPSAEDIAVFLDARDREGRAVGCGALRLREPESAQIKRMFVEPEARGFGCRATIVGALEDAARALNLTSLTRCAATSGRATCGSRNFGPFGGADISRCYTRQL